MRVAALLFIAACFASPLSTSSARAVPLGSLGIEAASSSDIQEVAGPRCGRGAHYVRGHHARNGHWIRGQCVRNRHH